MTSTAIPPQSGPADDDPAISWCLEHNWPRDMCYHSDTGPVDRPVNPDGADGRQVEVSPVAAPPPSGRPVASVPASTGRPVESAPVTVRRPVVGDQSDGGRLDGGEWSGGGRTDHNSEVVEEGEAQASALAAVAKLGWKGWTGVSVLAILGVALGVVGFAISFETVAKAVEPAFGDLAWLVPLGVDLGIFVFAGVNLVLAYLNMPVRWLRLIPWGLTAATIYLNASAYDEVIYQVAHIALPLLWIIISEVVTHVAGLLAGIRHGTATDAIPLARWVIAPFATARLWRLMRLWDIRSYQQILASERERMLAYTAMQDRYSIDPHTGKRDIAASLWRSRVPPMLWRLYGLRELTAAQVYAWDDGAALPGSPEGSDRSATTASTTTSAGTDQSAAKGPTGRKPMPTSTTKRSTTQAAKRRPVDVTARVGGGRSKATGDNAAANKRLAAAWAKFKATGRRPSGQELADAANCSKTYANDWKRNRMF